MNIWLKQILIFIPFLGLQVILFNKITLWDTATPFVFLIFLLMLPFRMNFAVSILVGFVAGLLIDEFSVNMMTGLHAFSCTLMMAVRKPWIETITTKVAFQGNEDLFLEAQPYTWYISYIFPMVLVHHISYFMLEAFGFQNFLHTTGKIIFSTFYTGIFCVMLALILYNRTKRR